MSSNKKIILTACLLLGGAIIYWQLGQTPIALQNDNSNATSSLTTTTNEGSNQLPTTPKGSAVSTTNKPSSVTPSSGTASSFIITPAKGEAWMIDKSHEIRWNKNSGYSGSIILIDASTDKTVGWIAPTVIGSQVTYNWDTANIQLSATNPTKKLISPGIYYIQILFNGSAIKLRSENFSIIDNKNEVLLTQQVKITNSNFTPNYTTVKRGEKVVLINENQNTNETILMGGVAIAVLLPHHSYLIDTAQFAIGDYEVRLSGNTISRLILSVK